MKSGEFPSRDPCSHPHRRQDDLVFSFPLFPPSRPGCNSIKFSFDISLVLLSYASAQHTHKNMERLAESRPLLDIVRGRARDKSVREEEVRHSWRHNKKGAVGGEWLLTIERRYCLRCSGHLRGLYKQKTK